jgi:hypothetical protein
MVAKGKGNKMEQTETLEVRMERALKAIRRAGIVARRNVMSCCRSCVDLGLAGNVPVIWHFGGQGNRTAIEGNYATFSSMYFNHDNLATAEGLTEAGKVVLKAFEDNGITVEWQDQSPYKCLEVILK